MGISILKVWNSGFAFATWRKSEMISASATRPFLLCLCSITLTKMQFNSLWFLWFESGEDAHWNIRPMSFVSHMKSHWIWISSRIVILAASSLLEKPVAKCATISIWPNMVAIVARDTFHWVLSDWSCKNWVKWRNCLTLNCSWNVDCVEWMASTKWIFWKSVHAVDRTTKTPWVKRYSAVSGFGWEIACEILLCKWKTNLGAMLSFTLHRSKEMTNWRRKYAEFAPTK